MTAPMRSTALARCRSPGSATCTDDPVVANACAIPAPIVPAPMVPTFMASCPEGVDTGERAADDEFLDLTGAFVQRHHPGVPQVFADRIFVDIAIAAVDLNGGVGAPDGDLAGEQLGLGR